MRRRLGRSRTLFTLLVAFAAGGAALAGTVVGASSTAPPIKADRYILEFAGHVVPFVKLVDMDSGAVHFEPPPGDDFGRGVAKRSTPQLTIQRPATTDNTIDLWFAEAVQGTPVAFKDAALTVFNKRDEPVARWALINAFPSRLKMTQASTGVLNETVTFAAEDIVKSP